MGLLDQFSEFAATPAGQGLLSGIFGGMASAGHGGPVNTLGAAGMAGLQGYQTGQDRLQQAADAKQQAAFRDMQGKMYGLQLQDAQRKAEQEAKIAALVPQFARPAQVATAPEQGNFDKLLPADFQTGLLSMPGSTAAPAGFDMQGYAKALQAIDPIRGYQLQQELAPKQVKLGAGEAMFGADGKKLFDNPKEQTENGELQQYKFAQSQGYAGSFEDWIKATNESKATKVSVSNTIPKSVGGEVGPIVKDSYASANTAVDQMNTANEVLKALGTGKAITGPYANLRQTAAQVAQTLGIGGKDTAEQILNTQSVMKGMAEMALNAASYMRGQGAITEGERVLLNRAKSGDITMTAGELKQVAQATQRAAQAMYDQHQNMLNNLASDKDTLPMAKFFKPRSMPAAYGTAPAPAQQSGGSKVVDFGSLR